MTDAVQHVITMGLYDHLDAIRGDSAEESANLGLTRGMQVSFGILDDQQAARFGDEPRHDDREGIGHAEAHVWRASPLAANTRGLEAQARDHGVRKPFGLNFDRSHNSPHPPLGLMQKPRQG